MSAEQNGISKVVTAYISCTLYSGKNCCQVASKWCLHPKFMIETKIY